MATLNVTVNSGGIPLEGAKVVISRNQNRQIQHTGNNGVATFENISNAQYSIEVTKPYYTIQTGTVGVSGTTNRQYSLSEVSGSSSRLFTPSSGRVEFTSQPTGDYYVILEDDTWEEVVSYETLDEDGRAPIYRLREVRSNVNVNVKRPDGTSLRNAIVHLGSSLRVSGSGGYTEFTVYDGQHQLIVSHPDYEIHSRMIDVTEDQTLTVQLFNPDADFGTGDSGGGGGGGGYGEGGYGEGGYGEGGGDDVIVPEPDPDRNPPPNDATFIGHASIEPGESINVTVEEDVGVTGSYDNSTQIQLSDGYNQIPLTLEGGYSRYRWTANFSSNTIEGTPNLFAGNVHIGITEIQGVVELNGIQVPVYEPDTIGRPQLQFSTREGPLSARLSEPSSDDILQVEVNGSVYGVDL